MSSVPLWALLLTLIALLIASAFFTAVGTSLLAVHRQRLKRLQTHGDHRAKRVRRMLKQPDRLVSAVVIGNHLATMLAAVLAAAVGWQLLGPLGSAVALLVLTVMQLVFAEMLPRQLAIREPEKIALRTSAVSQLAIRLLQPLVWLVSRATALLMDSQPRKLQERVEVIELRTLAAETGQLMPESHQSLLLRLLELDQLTVDDVMVPRADIVGIDLELDDGTLLERLRHCVYTQLPAFRDDLDNVVGLLHLRTVAQLVDDSGQLDRSRLEPQLQPVYFVPEGTPLQAQLLNFQRQKRQLALVVDEYGSVLGLITLEDILEQMVNVVASVTAQRCDGIVPQDDGTWLIDGTANLRELNRQLGWDLDLGGPKTLGGLLLEHLETFPDGPIALALGDYGFEVLEMDGRKIKRVRAFTRG
jgi:Mg2+/Co2+ transporter CorB